MKHTALKAPNKYFAAWAVHRQHRLVWPSMLQIVGPQQTADAVTRYIWNLMCWSTSNLCKSSMFIGPRSKSSNRIGHPTQITQSELYTATLSRPDALKSKWTGMLYEKRDPVHAPAYAHWKSGNVATILVIEDHSNLGIFRETLERIVQYPPLSRISFSCIAGPANGATLVSDDSATCMLHTPYCVSLTQFWPSQHLQAP